MKKILISIALLSLSILLLYGCGKKKEDVIEGVPTETLDESTATESNADDTTPNDSQNNTSELDTPPSEGMVRSPITNEWVTKDIAQQRPLAVMIPNDPSSLPHYNISNADVLYECLVEGGMTRLMAIFGDWQSLERIGNIRSCRDYYVYWCFEWDAVYVHFGGPFYIDEVISRADTQNINGLNAPSGVFYRTNDRPAPQNAYIDGATIAKEINRLGYPMKPRNDMIDDMHFQFASYSSPNTLEDNAKSVLCNKIDLSSAYPVTGTKFEYDAAEGVYRRSQKAGGGPHIDAVNNTQLSFKNLIIQFTHHEVRDKNGYLAFQCNDTTRDGWFFTNGRGIHVNWKKTSDYSATRYYDDNGKEILFNPGKTMICIVPDGDSFTYE